MVEKSKHVSRYVFLKRDVTHRVSVQTGDSRQAYCQPERPTTYQRGPSPDTSPGWRDPIFVYLKAGTLPDDRAEAQKLLHLATRIRSSKMSYTRSLL